MLKEYLKTNNEYNNQAKEININYPNLDINLIKKEIILSDLINFLDNELFKKINTNWILCGVTNLLKCHNIIKRLSEDIDILIIKESNSQAKKIVPKIYDRLTKLNNENIFSIILKILKKISLKETFCIVI